jgi:hypothetical protein
MGEEQRLRELRPKLFGDILQHISLASETKVRRHEDFADVDLEKSPRMLWQIVVGTHIAPENAGDLGVWATRKELTSMHMGGKASAEEYCTRYKRQYEKTLAIGDDQITDALAMQTFLMSLDGPRFGSELARWARNQEMPDSLDEAMRRVIEFETTTKNAERALGRRGFQEQEEVAYKTTHSGSSKWKEPGDSGCGSETKICPICKKKSKHAIEDCWELDKFCKAAQQKKKQASEAKAEPVPTVNAVATKKKKKRGQWVKSSITEEDDDIIAITEDIIRAAKQSNTKGSFFDCCATTNMWGTTRGIRNIRDGEPIFVKGINGRSEHSKFGEHPDFGDVIIEEANEGFNIVSQKILIKKGFKIYYNNELHHYRVWNHAQEFIFDRTGNGLYRLRSTEIVNTELEIPDTIFVPSGAEAEAEAPAEVELEQLPSTQGGIIATKGERERATAVREACRMLGHVGSGALSRAIRAGTFSDFELTTKDVELADRLFGPCHGCTIGKSRNSKIGYVPQSSEQIIVERRVETIHADFYLLPGNNIIFVSVGEVNRLIIAVTCKSRKTEDIVKAWRSHLSVYSVNGITVTRAYTDSEAGISASRVALASFESPVELIQQPPGVHEPFIEVRIRTIRERSRSILADLPFKLPKKLLIQLTQWAIQGINLLPDSLNTADDSRSAREKVFGRKSRAKLCLRFGFGDFVIFHTDTHGDHNLQARGEIGIVVGRNIESGSIKIWDFTKDSYVMRGTATKILPTGAAIAAINRHEHLESTENEDFLTKIEKAEDIRHRYKEDYKDMSDSEEDSDYDPDDDEDVSESSSSSGEDLVDEGDEFPIAEEIPPPTGQPEAIANENVNRYNLRQSRGLLASIHSLTAGNLENKGDTSEIIFSQMTLQESMNKMPVETKKAVISEMQALLDFQVFEPVLEKGISKKSIIPCSIPMKEKFKADGSFEKLKARFVAGGHRQEWNTEDSYSSPTAPWTLVMIGLVIAQKHGLRFVAVDIPLAYPRATRVGTPVYMRVPRKLAEILFELEPSWKEFECDDGSIVMLIKKALYGLKDSGKQWYDNIRATLEEIGFRTTDVNPCAFIREIDGILFATVILYVDDILIFVKQDSEMVRIIGALEQKYGKLTIQDGPKLSFIGAMIVKNEDGSIFVSCKGFVDKLLDKHGVTRGSPTPLPSNFSAKTHFENDEPADQFEYRSIVMSVMYLAKKVRPDLLFAASLLATKCQAPTAGYLQAAHRVLKYLYHTREKGILIRVNPEIGTEVYADASYNCYVTGHSQSGILGKLGGIPICFSSVKEKSVVKASCDAELISGDRGVDVALWVDHAASELGYGDTATPVLYQDNTSAVLILQRGAFTKTRAMISVRLGYIKEQLENERIKIKTVGTKAMEADILTKVLHGEDQDRAAKFLISDPK